MKFGLANHELSFPRIGLLIFSLLPALFLLAACAPASTPAPTATSSTSSLPATPVSRITMLPTWTPSPTPPLKDTPTPRPTNTPLPGVSGSASFTPANFTTTLVDRPTYASLPKPASLVYMQYDPSVWLLNTSYPTAYMGYSLTHKLIYNCVLEPTLEGSAEGYQVEQYNRPLGSTPFDISRFSKDALLASAEYCTGEGEDHSCYRLSPGDDHEACLQDAETVLSTYQLVPNQFSDPFAASPNSWLCQDQSGVDGRCMISYSVPLNALVYPGFVDGWAAGDDGLLFQLSGQSWSQVTAPTDKPIYDLAFSNSADGWAVGDGAQILHWDGAEWSEVLPFHGLGEGPGGSTQVLYSVDAPTRDDAWMVGSIQGPDMKIHPYALHWNGTDLVEENTFPDCACGLNAVLSLDENNVLAVGTSDLGAIAFRWDGSQWTSTQLPGADALYALRQSPDGTVWAAGIEFARDQSDTRGALFRWDGASWNRVALPPLTGGIYQLAILPSGQVVLGGDFSALWTGSEWQPITAGLAGYGWIVDIEIDSQGVVWALTRSGNIFRLEIGD